MPHRNGFQGVGFTSWSSREDHAPRFERFEENGEMILRISSGSYPFTHGIWKSDAAAALSGVSYGVSVQYSGQGLASESRSVYLMLTWTDREDRALRRDYVTDVWPGEDGWTLLHGLYTAPQGAAGVTAELALRWSPNGSVRFRAQRMTRVETPGRRVLAAAAYMRARGSVEANVGRMLELIDLSAIHRTDILCFTEIAPSVFTKLSPFEASQPVPGPLTDLIGQRARQHRMYVVFSLYEKDGDTVYNTAVVFGRDGGIVGKYRKTHLPLTESAKGVAPGSDYPVFDLDFGRIGILICWDQVFSEPARMLRLQGAEIIFLPSLGDEPLLQRARARDNGVYLIVSGIHSPQASRIIDPLGEIIGQVSGEEEGFCLRELNLDQRHYTYWHSVGPCFGETGSLLVKERQGGSYALISGEGLVVRPPDARNASLAREASVQPEAVRPQPGAEYCHRKEEDFHDR